MIDWKDKLNGLKEVLPEGEHIEVPVPQPKDTKKGMLLRVEMDKRKGKPSTLVTDFTGTDDELKELTRVLKQKCSAGGSCRDGEILIQGDFRSKIADLLIAEGYKVKRINFK